MGKTVLGLDLGITSIGWALVNVDDDNLEKNKIIDSGVRIFTVAEHPKDGKSLALPRREARSARRTTKRKAQKLRAIKRLLIKCKILTQDELDNLFIGNKNQKDVWDLRREALYRKVDNKELSRIMIHLAKHRGYFSNRKSEEPSDSEGKAVLSGITKNKNILQTKNYITIGEYISTKSKKRNGKDAEGKLNYENSVARSMLIDEINIIFARQKEFKNKLVNDELLQAYKTIAFEQRPLKSVAGMVANCPFEVDEKRASKSSYTFELFRALQKLKNIRLLTDDGEDILSNEQIKQAIDEAKNKTTPRTYKHIRKLFNISEAVKFKGLVYYDHKTGEISKKDPENEKLIDFSAYQKIKKVIQESDNLYWQIIENDSDILDAIATILTTEKNDKESLKQLKEIVESEKVCEALISLSFSQFGHLSVKAIKKIIPYLEDGLDYDKACEKAAYDFKAVFKGNKSRFLPPLTKQENLEMTNPVVKRAIAQMRLVYNAIARKYGELDAVHVEFTRDIKKSHKDRNDIKKAQGEFRETKEKAREQAIDKLGKEPNAKELLKFRLWEEQNGHCIYSGTYINPHTLVDAYATEVDHILPYSRSMDDSLNNKVLCLTKENQDKGSKTPFEYMGSDINSKKWLNFEVRVKANKNIRQAKEGRLLKINFDENSENAFKDRNKNDTSYISKFVKNYMEAHIAFKESKMKRHIFTMNGMLTTQLRYKWGVGDKNRDNHLHHAEDAIILAFSTQSMVQKLSTVSAKREGFIYKNKEEKSKNLRFETPLEEFGQKVKDSINGIFVSHMPRRKVGGAGHSQLPYRSYCDIDKNKELKKDRSSIKISKGVLVRGGVCENEDMCRVDVYVQKDTKKYFLIPLYTSDFVKNKLPNKAIVANKKPWVEMDENYEFRFSIFKNDILAIKQKNKDEVFGYFVGVHSGTANITIKEHSNIDNGSFKYVKDKETGKQNSLYLFGVKQSVEKFIKYQVDALGNYVEVKNEKRQGTIKEGKLQRKK